MTKRKPKSEKAKQLSRRSETFRRLVGITPELFFKICEQIRPLYIKAEKKRLNKLCPKRIRAMSFDGQYKLSMEDRILMLLMYYRLYVSYVFLGFLFGINDSNVCRNINSIQPLLARFFKIPERRVEMSEGEIIAMFLDGTEQPINRPKGKGQRKWYSGKKKRHTIKHQVIADKSGKILAVGKSSYGKVHDKKDYEKQRFVLPQGVPKKADMGYIGTPWQTPVKKPKNGFLSEAEKLFNRMLSKERIIIEHVIGKMKIYKILAERFRNPREKHMMIFKNIAGLYNMTFA